ncbi:MAG TPA: 3-hydroxyacyl-ACP dehydratase [Syntrophobacteraceae bacterium]|nr:3-hydroxyacyl-ACP dehydratase [Syntrophobacteraceae bacterium]
MRCAGIDIGSRAIKLAVVQNKAIAEYRQTDTGYDPMAAARRLLEGLFYDCILATGYGRGQFEVDFDAPTVTEIKAHAAGARFFFPEAVTVLDIGGQDSKAIAMNTVGKVVKFEMNDRCAAGTGKFLEIMARSLGFNLEQFASEALLAEKDIQINSMCTVFAESEVTSLVARGENRRNIALGLHKSVVRRAAGMLRRVSNDGPVVFSGGVAKNRCMQRLMEDTLQQPILTAKDPQMTGAIGAALLAGDRIGG